MSTIINNPLLKGASGMFGNLVVFRQCRGKVIMASRPSRRSKPSERQKEVVERFREASLYAKSQMEIPQARAEYEAGMTGKKTSPYQVAMTDYLNAPRVHYIDAKEYRGAAGNTITIRASDDFRVIGVRVMLLNNDGSLLEKGEAEPRAEGVDLWVYTTSVDNPHLTGTVIKVTAFDKPGNASSLEVVMKG